MKKITINNVNMLFLSVLLFFNEKYLKKFRIKILFKKRLCDLMPFEEKIEKVYGTILDQIEKMEKKITKENSMKEITQSDLKDLGFTDEDINYLVFKKRLLIKYKNDLGSNNIQDIIYEIPSDYYYQKILSNQKIKHIKRLKELERMK